MTSLRKRKNHLRLSDEEVKTLENLFVGFLRRSEATLAESWVVDKILFQLNSKDYEPVYRRSLLETCDWEDLAMNLRETPNMIWETRMDSN